MELAFNPIQATPSFSANRTVLIVDDDSGIRFLAERQISKFLKQQPSEDTFEIKTASNVEEGQDFIKNLKPDDVLLSDCHIDGKNLETPDGTRLGRAAKRQGIKNIGLMTDDTLMTLPKVIKEGFMAISKGDLLNPENCKEFLGKLLRKIHP